LESAAIAVATLLPLLFPILCSAQQLTPAESLDRYLARASGPQPVSSDSVFTVQIDASIPTLHKHGNMTGLKLVSYTGQVAYRGLRFTGDKLVKTAVIARVLSNDSNAAGRTADVRFTPELLVHLQQEIGLQRACRVRISPEAPAQTGGTLSRRAVADCGHGWALGLWGDLVKSPSIFIRNFRFLQDYQMDAECSQPLRLVLTVRTRIAGTVEMVVWQHSAADSPESIGAGESSSQFPQGDQTSK